MQAKLHNMFLQRNREKKHANIAMQSSIINK